MITASMVKELRELTGAGMLDCKKALEEASGNLEKAAEWLREKGISKAAKKAGRIAAEGLVNILIEGNKALVIEVNSETDFVAKNDEFKDLINTISNLLINSNVKTVEEALQLSTADGTLENTITNKIAKIGEKISFRRFELVEKTDSEVFGSYSHMGGRICVLTVLEGANSDVARDVSMHAAAMRPNYITSNDVPADVIEHEKGIIKEQAINEGKPADIAEKMVNGRINKFFKEICLVEQAFVKDPDVTVGGYVKNNGGEIKSMVRYEVGEGIEKRKDDFASEVMSQINGN